MNDGRLIRRVRNITNALTKLKNLAPIQYKNRDGEATFSAGFVPQDFFKIFPEFVAKSNDDGTTPLPPKDPSTPGVQGWIIPRLDVLVPFIVAAIKELHEDILQVRVVTRKRIEAGEAKITTLETKVAALETRLLALEAQ